MYLYKNIIFLAVSVFMLFLQYTGFAQNAELSGTITDESGLFIEYADVFLYQLPDSVKVKTQNTNDKGVFEFKDIPFGRYYVVCFLFGYKKSISEVFDFNSTLPSKCHLKLMPDVVHGEEVLVSTQRALVRVEEGKTIVNVESSLSNAGQTVVDVLRKSPGVSVDQSGIIQLKGKSGVQVMLDDKVMYLSGEQLGNLLKSIPAEVIKEIEIISSPSAKYDASGNAGIINIRLKKGAYEGLNGTVNGSIGTGVYHKANAGVNLTYKKNKLSLNTGYQYNNKINLSDLYDDRKNDDPSNDAKRIYSKTYYTIPMVSHTFILNGQYSLTDKTSLTFDFTDSYTKYDWSGTVNSALYNQKNIVQNSYISTDNGTEKQLNSYSSLGFKHKLDTNGTLLSGYGAINLNKGIEDKLQDIQYLDSLGANTNNPFLFVYDNYSTTKQYNGQVDLEKKFLKNKLKFESGLKYVYMNDYKPVNVTITENHVQRDASNHFRYDESVMAAYTMLGYEKNKWSLQGGLRLESTHVKGYQSLIDSTFNRDYTNLFPSGNITYKQTDKTAYTLLYSRRITRPTSDQLNPVLNINDPFSAWGGNPYLLPQYADNVEFSHSVFDGVLVTTLNYTYIQHPIVWAYRLDKATNKYISGPYNLDYQENYGISVSINKAVTKWWTTNNNVLFNNNTFVGVNDFGTVNNQMNAWGFKSTQSLVFPKGYSLELSGLYDSPSTYAFSYSYDRWQLSAAVQKKILKDKATIKLAVNDMFWSFRYAGTNTMGTTTQESSYKWDNRTLILSFTYKFGNQLMK